MPTRANGDDPCRVEACAQGPGAGRLCGAKQNPLQLSAFRTPGCRQKPDLRFSPVMLRGWLLVLHLLSTSVQAASLEPAFRIGDGGWRLDQFDADNVVLRALTRAAHPAFGAVGVLVSCSGLQRRVRFTFPSQILGNPSQLRGRALITPTGPRRPVSGVIVHFTVSEPSTLVISEVASRSRDIARLIAGMLLDRPLGLDLLLSFGEKPVTLPALASSRLFAALDNSDTLTIGQFLEACKLPQ